MSQGFAMATRHPMIERYLGVLRDPSPDLVEISEKGLPIGSMSYLKQRGLTFSELSDVVSPRTVKHRKARGENLSTAETDRVLRLARILSLADRIFGNHEKALMWLRQTDERIRNRTPLSMLQTEAGGRLIEHLLWQIDDGVYS
jgi:putative toxin-antitoxin system antitoxin component (TIGR02293 family)